jgi:hypothetical protein
MSESVKQDKADKKYLDILRAYMLLQETESALVLSAAQKMDGFSVDRIKELGKQMLHTPENGEYMLLEVVVALQVTLSFLCEHMVAETDAMFEAVTKGKEDA